MDTGKVNITMDAYTAETRLPHWVSVRFHSAFKNGKREEMTILST
jgi:hypothetical protein